MHAPYRKVARPNRRPFEISTTQGHSAFVAHGRGWKNDPAKFVIHPWTIPNLTLQIDAEIARAWTLPARLYTDRAFSLPKRKRSSPERGRSLVTSARSRIPVTFSRPVLSGRAAIVGARHRTEPLRGFYNVCRHRAGPPAEGCGSRKLFRCGYHGWTYDLDGSLISATEIEGVEGFRPEDFALKPVRTEEWFNLVFVNLDPGAWPSRESLGELPQQAEKFPFQQMKLFERRTYDMQCNWKTYVDNYLEGYHLPSVHPGPQPRVGLQRLRGRALCAGSCRIRSPVQPDPGSAAGGCHAVRETRASAERRREDPSSSFATTSSGSFPKSMFQQQPPSRQRLLASLAA